jgi:hypothetical protein
MQLQIMMYDVKSTKKIDVWRPMDSTVYDSCVEEGVGTKQNHFKCFGPKVSKIT